MAQRVYQVPTHAESTSQLEVLAVRMERLAAGHNNPGTDVRGCAHEILAEALMVIARNMPDEPKRNIARILTAYDQV